jgi:5-methylcytosine-specific restriction endonuclease McrA
MRYADTVASPNEILSQLVRKAGGAMITPQELIEAAKRGQQTHQHKRLDRHRFSDEEDKIIISKYPDEIKTIGELARLLNVPKIAVAYHILISSRSVRMVYDGYPINNIVIKDASGKKIDKKRADAIKDATSRVVREIKVIIKENKDNLIQRRKDYQKEKNKWANKRVAKNLTLRRWVFDRDGNKCIACGAPDKLVLAHIIPSLWLVEGGVEIKDAFVPFNLATLCNECALFRQRPQKLLWDEETLALLKRRREIRGNLDGEAWVDGDEEQRKQIEKDEQEYHKIEAKFQANLKRIKVRTQARRELIEVNLSESWNFYQLDEFP